MKYFIFIFFLIPPELAQSQSKNSPDSLNFEKIYTFALRGEMDGVFEILKAGENYGLTPEQQRIKEGYYRRFLTNSEAYDYNTEDKVIIDLVKRFQNYWKSVLIEKVRQKIADSLFMGEMITFLQKEYKPGLTFDEIAKNHYRLFQEFFRSKGLSGNAMGKTAHLFDLYLWKDESTTVYDIKLPEETVKVPIVFMRDFICNGWTHYTTFGEKFTGGWAKSDKLYCVEEAYDLSSENFNIHYVTHEGQHFADYKTFPKLQQADLEYRAKLTQLALASESVSATISGFLSNADSDKKNAHAYADYYVIKSLSQKLFNIDYADQLAEWNKLSVQKINTASKQLLKEHTQKLNAKGASTVKSCIL